MNSYGKGKNITFLAGKGLIRSKITMLKIFIYLRTTWTLVYLLDACKNNTRVPGKDGLEVTPLKRTCRTQNDSKKLKIGLPDMKEKDFNLMTCQ